MTDRELLSAYNRYWGNKAELLGKLTLAGEDLVLMVKRLRGFGLHPELSLRKAWGTNKPEEITPEQIRDWLTWRGLMKPEKPKEHVVDAYCRGCVYRTKDYGLQACSFILMTGRRRGCPAGEGCNKRKIEKRRTCHADE